MAGLMPSLSTNPGRLVIAEPAVDGMEPVAAVFDGFPFVAVAPLSSRRAGRMGLSLRRGDVAPCRAAYNIWATDENSAELRHAAPALCPGVGPVPAPALACGWA